MLGPTSRDRQDSAWPVFPGPWFSSFFLKPHDLPGVEQSALWDPHGHPECVLGLRNADRRAQNSEQTLQKLTGRTVAEGAAVPHSRSSGPDRDTCWEAGGETDSRELPRGLLVETEAGCRHSPGYGKLCHSQTRGWVTPSQTRLVLGPIRHYH